MKSNICKLNEDLTCLEAALAEVEKARAAGFIPVGLGKRILRTETAPLFVLSCLCYEFEL